MLKLIVRFKLFEFILIALATWRISNMLVDENGLFNVFLKIRDLIGIKYYYYDTNMGQHVYLEFDEVVKSRFELENYNVEYKNTFSELFSCVYCMSIWVGFGFTVLHYLLPQLNLFLTTWLSASTVAIFLKRFI